MKISCPSFRRRQRDELRRQPLWSVCVDRAHDFVFRHNVRPYPAGVAAGGGMRRSNFIHNLSATRHYSVRSPELARAKHTTSKCRKRIQPCASGGAWDFQRRADSSAQKQGYSVAAGWPTPVR
jgi:hypothetical protein